MTGEWEWYVHNRGKGAVGCLALGQIFVPLGFTDAKHPFHASIKYRHGPRLGACRPTGIPKPLSHNVSIDVHFAAPCSCGVSAREIIHAL